MSQYSIFVNTSDGYSDCWMPFFTLFKKYWPECEAPIYLNTEREVFKFDGLNIISTQVQSGTHKKMSWSECLVAGLSQVRTPLVLYFQEDYFIDSPVRNDVVERAVDFMVAQREVRHIQLTHIGSQGPFDPTSEDWLGAIRKFAPYRISTQAAMWRIDTLLSYVEAEESGWMFEIFGTWRAWGKADCFLIANINGDPPAIHYLHTGVIKGKWLPEIAIVFERNQISLDLNARGFYKEKPKLIQKCELIKKLAGNPACFLNNFLYHYLPNKIVSLWRN